MYVPVASTWIFWHNHERVRIAWKCTRRQLSIFSGAARARCHSAMLLSNCRLQRFNLLVLLSLPKLCVLDAAQVAKSRVIVVGAHRHRIPSGSVFNCGGVTGRWRMHLWFGFPLWHSTVHPPRRKQLERDVERSVFIHPHVTSAAGLATGVFRFKLS